MSASSGSRSALASRVLFIIFAVVAIGTAAHGIRMQPIDPAWGARLVTWGGTAAVLFTIVALLPHQLRVNLSVAGATIVVGSYAFNVFIAFSPSPKVAVIERLDAKRRATPDYDQRTVREMVRDLRAKGVDAVPGLYALNALQDDGRPKELLPLVGISNATTVLCNELGEHAIYTSDARGFNNPVALERADVLLIGDSYTHGQCVSQDENLAGVLRQRGYRVYSIGVSANGPLSTLAALSEYGLALSPKIVIWGHSGDDEGAVHSEMLEPLLVRYLEDDGFTQKLASRSDEVDGYWHDLLERTRYHQVPHEPPVEVWRKQPTIKELATLYSLRTLLGLGRGTQGSSHDIYLHVVETAKRRVESVGGKLYVTSFPYFTYVERGSSGPRPVFSTLGPTGVALVDIDDVFFEHEDPPSLFPLRGPGHLSKAGFEAVANAMVERILEPNGITPQTATAAVH